MRVSKILSFSVVILLITVVFAGVVTVPVAAAAGDTMQYYYNATHNGDYSPVAGPAPSNGTELWNYTTGGRVDSPPAVVNGVVYVGSGDNNVYALNAANGKKVWNYTTEDTVYGSPAVVNGVVYVGSDSRDQSVYALNAASGTKLWSNATGYADYGVSSSPTVANGVVYVVDDGQNLRAFDAFNGAELWSKNLWSNSSCSRCVYGVGGSPAVASGDIYVGGDQLFAFNPSGDLLWNIPGSQNGFSSPSYANGTVYVADGNYASGSVYAFNAVDGTLLWSYKTGGQVSYPPVIYNNTVYVGSGDNNVYALNAANGKKVWNYTIGNADSYGYSGLGGSPTVANGVVYVGSLNNNLYAINAANGTLLWNCTTAYNVNAVFSPLYTRYSPPTIINGVVYVGASEWADYQWNSSVIAIGDNFSYIPNPVYVRDTVTFNATNSKPSSGIASYKWDFGDGSTGSGMVVTHAYKNPGTYVANVAVTASTGHTNKISKDIVVGDKWAVLVGENAYVNVPALPWGHNDADAIENLLIGSDHFNQTHVFEYKDASRLDIQNALVGPGGISTRAGPHDLVVFYFSGHGWNQTVPTKHSFLCPVEFDYTYKTEISDVQLAQWFNAIPSRNALLILDCCHAGGMSGSVTGATSQTQENVGASDLQTEQQTFISNFLAGIGGVQGSKYVMLMASRFEELERWSTAFQHAIFTYYLLASFNTGRYDLNGDHWISAEEAFAYASPLATAWTTLHNPGHATHPQIYDGNPAKDLDLKYLG